MFVTLIITSFFFFSKMWNILYKILHLWSQPQWTRPLTYVTLCYNGIYDQYYDFQTSIQLAGHPTLSLGVATWDDNSAAVNPVIWFSWFVVIRKMEVPVSTCLSTRMRHTWRGIGARGMAPGIHFGTKCWLLIRFVFRSLCGWGKVGLAIQREPEWKWGQFGIMWREIHLHYAL